MSTHTHTQTHTHTHTDTHRHTHTHTGEYSIVAVDNRNYNNWPQIGISTFKELTRPLWILLGNYGSTIMGCASHFI